MLHSRFSQLKLQQNRFQFRSGSDIAGDKMELAEDETNHPKQSEDGNFLVPDSATLKSMKKKLERMKHFRSTPNPRPTSNNVSSTKCFDQNETCLEFKDGARKLSTPSRTTSFGNGDVSPLAMSPYCSREKPPISDELANLCSDSPMYAFKSDSDNSSCLFADESFLSSADFTDDVFGDGNFTLSNSRGTRGSFTEGHSNWSKHKRHISAKFENNVGDNQTVVSKGAAIIGSPSKIRHKNQRVVRRIKSTSSFRFSPLKSSPGKAKKLWSGTRWYKAPTDTRLYEVRRRELKEFNQTAADTITLPKRVLQFGECENKKDQQESLVEKAKTEIHVELASCRTETPESGYGSLNSTRQTPDLPQVETPVTRFASRSPFPRAEHQATSSNFASYNKINNTCATPWLETFDIISRLFRMAPLVVEHIFTYLEPKDLVLFSSVSPQWRLICSSHSPTARIRDQYLRVQEKAYQIRKENLHVTSRSSVRHVTGPGTPLSSVQYLGTPTAASTPTKKTTVFDKFCQLGKQLKEGEKLEQCKCGSPARIETKTRKASCSSVHCQFEFCVKCKMNYHGNSPCVSSSASRRTRGPSVGSKKSKKNLRRHSRLSVND